MNIPDPTSLNVATNDELIDELVRRCFALVVAMSIPTQNGVTDASCGERITHRGNWHGSVGLAQSADAYFAKRVRKEA